MANIFFVYLIHYKNFKIVEGVDQSSATSVSDVESVEEELSENLTSVQKSHHSSKASFIKLYDDHDF
jgi:hypothetical protein